VVGFPRAADIVDLASDLEDDGLVFADTISLAGALLELTLAGVALAVDLMGFDFATDLEGVLDEATSLGFAGAVTAFDLGLAVEAATTLGFVLPTTGALILGAGFRVAPLGTLP